jgi:hypothetical protein
VALHLDTWSAVDALTMQASCFLVQTLAQLLNWGLGIATQPLNRKALVIVIKATALMILSTPYCPFLLATPRREVSQDATGHVSLSSFSIPGFQPSAEPLGREKVTYWANPHSQAMQIDLMKTSTPGLRSGSCLPKGR